MPAVEDFIQHRAFMGCIVCTDPEVTEINYALAIEGTPITYIPTRFQNRFSREAVHRHIKNCLQSTGSELRERHKIKQAEDVHKRLAYLLDEVEEGLLAAKKPLIVDGDLCFDPRAYEVSVVYLDYNDVNENTQEPKQKTAKLSKLLARLSEAGYEPQHSYIKSEDARKSWRDCIERAESLIDRYMRVFGLYKRDAANPHDEYEEIKTMLNHMAKKFDTSLGHELFVYLEERGERLRADIRGMLEKDCLDTFGALPGPVVEVKALPQPQTLSPVEFNETDSKKNIEENIPVVSQITLSPQDFTKDQEKQNIGENIPEPSPIRRRP